MILTYDEGFKRASNPEWFKSFFKRDEIATDEEVKGGTNGRNFEGDSKTKK